MITSTRVRAVLFVFLAVQAGFSLADTISCKLRGGTVVEISAESCALEGGQRTDAPVSSSAQRADQLFAAWQANNRTDYVAAYKAGKSLVTEFPNDQRVPNVKTWVGAYEVLTFQNNAPAPVAAAMAPAPVAVPAAPVQPQPAPAAPNTAQVVQMIAPPPVVVALPPVAPTAPAAYAFRDCPDCPVMVAVPGKNYAIGQYEVTVAEWNACVSGGGCNDYKPNSDSADGKLPVGNVNWNDAVAYAQWLSTKTGRSYRLPLEKEWEFACDGGHKAQYCGSDDADKVAWFPGNSGGHAHAVGAKEANGYGIYDMSGNVWEWLNDCMDKSCTKFHMLRGGSVKEEVRIEYAKGRLGSESGMRRSDFGLRLATTLQ
jgi:formylglycine-generating enzyme required for sulfatase activity